jgi:hypothetical protein
MSDLQIINFCANLCIAGYALWLGKRRRKFEQLIQDQEYEIGKKRRAIFFKDMEIEKLREMLMESLDQVNRLEKHVADLIEKYEY